MASGTAFSITTRQASAPPARQSSRASSIPATTVTCLIVMRRNRAAKTWPPSLSAWLSVWLSTSTTTIMMCERRNDFITPPYPTPETLPGPMSARKRGGPLRKLPIYPYSFRIFLTYTARCCRQITKLLIVGLRIDKTITREAAQRPVPGWCTSSLHRRTSGEHNEAIGTPCEKSLISLDTRPRQ